jgi:hypothetical protein
MSAPSASSPAQQALDILTALQFQLSNSPAVAGSVMFESQIVAAMMLLAEAILGTAPSTDTVAGGSDTNVDVSMTQPVDTPSS